MLWFTTENRFIQKKKKKSTITICHCLEKQIFPKERELKQRVFINFISLFLCFSLTKLHLLMRLRWGPSPASCSASGTHFPAWRHASTPGIKEREQRKLKLQLIMLTLRECDKAVLHTKDDSLFYHKLEDFMYWHSCRCWQRKMPTAWWS